MIETHYEYGSKSIEDITDSIIINFINDVRSLLSRYNNVRVYLYGSRIWANKNFKDDSDIDICISCKDNVDYILFETDLRDTYSGYVKDIKRLENITSIKFAKDIVDNGLLVS